MVIPSGTVSGGASYIVDIESLTHVLPYGRISHVLAVILTIDWQSCYGELMRRYKGD